MESSTFEDHDAASIGSSLSPESIAITEEKLYASDIFRMTCFKVLPCCKQYNHNWKTCPFLHEGEKAGRRDPQKHRYVGIECQDAKKGECPRGDECPYAHNLFEFWLHPSRYRTQLCNKPSACRRKVCFFAHSVKELRQPFSNAKIESVQQKVPIEKDSNGVDGYHLSRCSSLESDRPALAAIGELNRCFSASWSYSPALPERAVHQRPASVHQLYGDTLGLCSTEASKMNKQNPIAPLRDTPTPARMSSPTIAAYHLPEGSEPDDYNEGSKCSYSSVDDLPGSSGSEYST